MTLSNQDHDPETKTLVSALENMLDKKLKKTEQSKSKFLTLRV